MIIGVFEMVVIVVLAAMASGIIKQYLENKNRTSDEVLLERITALEGKVGDDSLEERVRVLEKIVTDRSEDLKSKIDSLKD